MIARQGNSIGIIGGGLGGLAAACTLAARGYEVTLLERNAWVGGKAAVLEAEGFRFDMGPTILTLPSVLKRIFAEAGRRLEDYLQLAPLDPQWRCFYSDQSTLDLVADVAAMRACLEKASRFAGDGAGYERFLELSRRLHAISDRHFFWKSVGSLFDMLGRGSFHTGLLSDFAAIGMGRTVAKTVRSHVKDERVAQMLDHFTQYVGSAPDFSPAVLCGIAHMQTEEGIWYPMGGTRAVPEALSRLAEELGVKIRTNCKVARCQLEKGRVTGLVTEEGETLPFDAVVSNSDVVRTFRELLPEAESKKFLGKKNWEPACSGVVLYLGLRKRYDHLLHHNFVFSRDAHEEFEWIYRKGDPAPDPTCYVCAPAATEPDVAPEGGEALYILVHTPYLRDRHDWKRMLPAYREVIFNKLASTAGMTDLAERVVYESALTPHDIDVRYHVLRGAIYGLASHGAYLGAFKPANRCRMAPGLYLAGGSAHPGPGMPMVMMSGWIAADALDQDRGPAAARKGAQPAASPLQSVAAG